MRHDLPEGWVLCELGALVAPSKKKAVPAETNGRPYIGLEHIEGGTNRIIGHGASSEVKSTTAVFSEGDVLFSKLRPYLNKVAVAPFDGVGSTEILVFERGRHLESKYLMWLLSRDEMVRIANERAAGVQLPRITFEKIADVGVPVAPIREQSRIVEKVEVLLEQVGRARVRLDRVSLILKRFRQAILVAACSGELTKEWREEHGDVEPAKVLIRLKGRSDLPSADEHLTGVELPPSWAAARVDTLVHVQNGRAFPSTQYSDAGIRLLRPGNLHVDGHLDWQSDNTVCLPVSWAREFPSYVIGEHELLMNLTAQSLRDEFLGRVCLKDDSEPALLNQRIARFVGTGGFDIRPYLFIYFKSPRFRRFVDGLDTGSLIRHMNSKDVGRHVLHLPPAEEQVELVRRVRALMSVARKVEQQLAAVSSRTGRLSQAVFAKAFRGELVATEAELAEQEGRPYETASELLERIRREREGGASTEGHSPRASSRGRARARPLAASSASGRQRTETLGGARAKRG